jgi:uncharacterized repeat protein (TIGR02543 family)
MSHWHGEAYLTSGTAEGSRHLLAHFGNSSFATANEICANNNGPDTNFNIDNSKITEVWNHYTIVEQDNVTRVFMNGQYIYSANSNGFPFGNWHIGRHWWDGGVSESTRLVASLANLRIYNRALTTSEVSELYSSERPRFQIIEGSYTWHEAKVDAEARGGRLAVLDTHDKIDAVNSLMATNGYPNSWIGLTDEIVEGQWRWLSGELLTESQWDSSRGQPDLGDSEDYAGYYHYYRQNTWHDMPDHFKNSYVIEFFRPLNLDFVSVSNGTIQGAGAYQYGSSATLTATPNPGYIFSGWTGDASGTDNPLTLTMDGDKTVGANFGPDLADNDGDALSNYAEVVTHGTNPDLADTDGDGFPDGVEVESGSDPKDPENRPDPNPGPLFTDVTTMTPSLAKHSITAVMDYNKDGKEDLLAWTDSGTRLLKQTGSFQFDDVTSVSGLDGLQSPVVADFTNDGLEDILDIASDKTYASIRVNNGEGYYVKSDLNQVVQGDLGSYRDLMTGDIDNDGDIDLIYAVNPPFGGGAVAYLPNITVRGAQNVQFGEKSYLVRTSWQFAKFDLTDANNDGLTDLVILQTNGSWPNDTHPDHPAILYLGAGRGQNDYLNPYGSISYVGFVEKADCGINAANEMSRFISWDIDNDGDLDLINGSSDWRWVSNPDIYINDGAGNYAQQSSPVYHSGQYYHHGITIFDADADNDLDAVWTQLHNFSNIYPRMWKNEGGLAFIDATAEWGITSQIPGSGNLGSSGYAADLDGDGDQDFVVQAGNAWGSESYYAIYRNNAESKGSKSLKIELEGTSSHAKGFGARVEVRANGKTLTQWVSNHVGSVPTSRLHFGLGASQNVEWINVYWPSGLKSSLTNSDIVGSTLKITEPAPRFQIIVGSDNGTISGGGYYQIGATATLTATPNPGYIFSGWTGDASGTANPLTLTMDADKTVGATFGPDLSDSDGDGLTNYKEATVYFTDLNLSDTDGDSYSDGEEIELKSDPNDISSIPGDPDGDGFFRAWILEGTGLLDASGGDTMVVDESDVPLASGIAAAGYFTLTEAEVADALANEDYDRLRASFVTLASDDFVTGVRDVLIIGAPVPGFYYFYIDLGIQPAILLNRPLYSFLGNGSTLANSTQLALVRHSYQITKDYQPCYLFFNPYDEHTVVFGTTGESTYSSEFLGTDIPTATIGLRNIIKYRNLTITATNGSVDAQSTYPDGETAILTATPNPGYVFSGWNGDASGTANPLSLTMDADKSLEATFSPDLADADGDGLSNYDEIINRGTDPNLADTDNDGLKDGEEVNSTQTNPLIADTDGDDLLDGVEVNTHGTDPLVADTDGDSYSDSYEIDNSSDPLDPKSKPVYLLTLSDGGVVTGGSFAFTGSLAHGTYATLTATPADGYLLSGWTGDASGTEKTLQLLMDADKTVGATFVPDSRDFDGDGLTNYQEIVEHNTNPNMADTNSDGLRDGLAAALGMNPNENHSLFVETILAERAQLGLRKESDITDMRPGSMLLQRAPGSNKLQIRMKMQKSSNMLNWQDDGEAVIEVPVDPTSPRQFYRFGVK